MIPRRTRRNNLYIWRILDISTNPTDNSAPSLFCKEIDCDEPNWDEIARVIDDDSSMLEWNGPYMWNVMHFACLKKAPLEFIQWLYDQRPELLLEPDDDGHYPLHLACEQPSPTDMLLFLIQKGTSAVFEQNESGRFPIHLACEWNQSIDVIQKLLNVYPSSVNARDRAMFLPIHDACWCGQSMEVIQFLVNANPESVFSKTESDDDAAAVARIRGHVNVAEWIVDYQKHFQTHQKYKFLMLNWAKITVE